MRSYLNEFHDETQEEARKKSTIKAFIPKPNRHILGLRQINRDMLAFAQSRSPSKVATIDLDATIVYADKEQALHRYKGPKAYQPLNAWWAEQNLVLHTEFRDGNVPACYDNYRVLTEALGLLPEGVTVSAVLTNVLDGSNSLLPVTYRDNSNRQWGLLPKMPGNL